MFIVFLLRGSRNEEKDKKVVEVSASHFEKIDGLFPFKVGGFFSFFFFSLPFPPPPWELAHNEIAQLLVKESIFT